MAFHAIKAGEGDQYIAAGVEAVSRTVETGPFEFHPQLDGSEGSLYNVYIPMGLTAENVAEEYGVSRESQDEWAAISQQPRRRGSRERPLRQGDRPGDRPPTAPSSRTTTARARARRSRSSPRCSPSSSPTARVTAGNACPLNDGAAAMLIMSEEKANSLGLKPRARIVASTVAAIRPEVMGIGPIPAIQKLLEPGRHDDRRHRHRRDQRGVRGADRAVHGGAGHPRGEAQPVRRRDRPRPSVRHDRRAHHDHAAQRPRDDRRHLRHRVDVRRRRHGQAMLVERLN